MYKVIKLFLLDRKLHSKTTFFKREKDWETEDLALHGILGEKKPKLFFSPCVGFSNLECNLIQKCRVLFFFKRQQGKSSSCFLSEHDQKRQLIASAFL